jgi:putative hydrolase of the HAD superfamily
MWSQTLIDVLDELTPGHGVLVEQIRPHLNDGFPWHRPEESHFELATPDLWWASLAPLFEKAYEAVGTHDAVVPSAAAQVRVRYCDPGGFRLYPDTVGALTALRRAGWRTVVLSNHVPELPEIVDGLGLGGLFDDVLTSATIGYEKPRPEAFCAALDGAVARDSFMVGDNPIADVQGAESAGLNAILVRNPARAHLSAADVFGAAAIILGS